MASRRKFRLQYGEEKSQNVCPHRAPLHRWLHQDPRDPSQIRADSKIIRVVQSHENVAFMRDTIFRLEVFLITLPWHSGELDDVKLRSAHRYLHFINMVYDISSSSITRFPTGRFSSVYCLRNDTREDRSCGTNRTIKFLEPRSSDYSDCLINAAERELSLY